MSTLTEHSAWSPDEADSLENIDKEIQLVSTSTESYSALHQGGENGSGGHKKITSDSSLKAVKVPRQSNLNSFHSKSYDNLQAIKFHSSCDDLCLQKEENKFRFNNCGSKNFRDSCHHPYTLLSNCSAKKPSICDNFHIKSKLINNEKTAKHKEVRTKKPGFSDKEDYLEQINKQLTKELDEKNAILSLLQENYEHLLFKYAEAQNRIDELRFKFLAEKSEPQNFEMKYPVLNNQAPFVYKEDYFNRADAKCQKALVTPFINLNEPQSPPSENAAPSISRPSSLPLDNGLKFREKDLLKATTPTDSEGLSSIITSMSGHSKILNSLDEENQMSKKSNFFRKKNNFLLQENVVSNDPFDKVKNWQNSLPPLEQIETPETTLYNINNAYSSTDTNYKNISSPKTENEYIFSDESCPLSWREDPHIHEGKCETKKSKISSHTLNKSQFYPKNSATDRDQFHEGISSLKQKSPSQNNILSTCIIQRRQKRPPLLRCSSLPAYDCDSIRSANCKNGIYIPPLDLNNVTVSDDESYCQQDYCLSKSKAITSSSFISSQDSTDRSLRTPQSFSSCKVTISEERVPRQTISKSTSITPDRSRAMDLSFSNRDHPEFAMSTSKTSSASFAKECDECNKFLNRCNVCGESLPGDKNTRLFGSRSNSCENVPHKKDVPSKDTSGRCSKPPFKRSVSFGSGTNTPRYCSHEKETLRSYFSGLNEGSTESFDAYTNNLKARSQAVIKALTAHVNNS